MIRISAGRLFLTGILNVGLAAICPVSGATLYSTTFDFLEVARTENPARALHDGWTRDNLAADDYGEIQNSISLGGNALHEFSAITTGDATQSGDFRRFPTAISTSGLGTLTLAASFFGASDDYSLVNPYAANLLVSGGPFPGFSIIDFGLHSGNGTPKSVAGLNVGLGRFNGLNNNEPVALSVGQKLAWEQWHDLVLTVDLLNNEYLSLTVDGVTQNLTGIALPRSNTSMGWLRGQLIETLRAEVVASDFPRNESNDGLLGQRLPHGNHSFRTRRLRHPGLRASFAGLAKPK